MADLWDSFRSPFQEKTNDAQKDKSITNLSSMRQRLAGLNNYIDFKAVVWHSYQVERRDIRGYILYVRFATQLWGD